MIHQERKGAIIRDLVLYRALLAKPGCAVCCLPADTDQQTDALNLMNTSTNDQEAIESLSGEIAALRATLREYRVLLDESSDPIFAFHPDGQYRYVNHAFAAGVGLPRDQIVGRTIWDVFSKEEADKRYAVVQWVFAHREMRVIEVRVPRPEGDHYYITTVKPILDESGKAISVICISKEITERKRMEERLAHMAQYDALTDLPNRALFNDRLVAALSLARRDGHSVALLLIDLDRFKPVNDALGHQVGDLLLQAAARRMQACLRESDSIGRIGGDEFVVLLPVVNSESDAITVGRKINSALEAPFALAEHPPITVSASIGIALFPEHAVEEIQLFKRADEAMYRAKRGGPNRTLVFQSS